MYSYGAPVNYSHIGMAANVKFPRRMPREGKRTRERIDDFHSGIALASRAIMPVLLGSDMSSLGASLLRGPWPSPSTIQASALWSDQTTVIYAIRRMG